jgi:hypothetical protein
MLEEIKLKLNLNKFGYIQIDLMFAGILFFLFLSLTYVSYQDFFEISNSNDELILLSSSARDLCVYFRNDLTYNSELNLTKFTNYTNSNYISTKKLIGFENLNFELTVIEPLSDTFIHSFGFSSPKTSFSQSYSCYAYYNSDVYLITTEVWK